MEHVAEDCRLAALSVRHGESARKAPAPRLGLFLVQRVVDPLGHREHPFPHLVGRLHVQHSLLLARERSEISWTDRVDQLRAEGRDADLLGRAVVERDNLRAGGSGGVSGGVGRRWTGGIIFGCYIREGRARRKTRRGR